jgi:hypothetical protein
MLNQVNCTYLLNARHGTILVLALLLATTATSTFIRGDADDSSGPSEVVDSISSSSGPSEIDSISSSGPDAELSPPDIDESISDPSNEPEALGPVEVARQRLEGSTLPTGLEGQEWFWKKLGKVTEEIKYPVIPEFHVEAVDPK